METVNVTVRMERQTRDDTAKLFSGLGISATRAINMFLKQAVREQGIPSRSPQGPQSSTAARAWKSKQTCPSCRPPQRLAARPAAISVLHTFDRSKV